MVSEFYAWLVQIFPWIETVAPWVFAAKSLFDKVEGVALFVGLLWVVRLLKKERLKLSSLIDDLGQRVDTSAQIANAAREAAETAMSRPSGATQFQAGSTANWEIIREDWQQTRDRLELAINRIPNKAKRAKYGKINRYSYADVINQLREDEQLKSDRAWVALINMNQKFLGPTDAHQQCWCARGS